VRPTQDIEVWTQNLKKGENYFALPFIPYEHDIRGLFSRSIDAIEEISYFDKGKSQWCQFYPSIPAFSVMGGANSGTSIGLNEDLITGNSLVFRVVASKDTVLYLEGNKFTSPDLKDQISVEDRMTLGRGWNFMGALWDSSEASVLSTDGHFVNHLNNQGFLLGRDYLYLWKSDDQSWMRLDSATKVPDPLERGSVFMYSFAGDADKDPYFKAVPAPAFDQAMVDAEYLKNIANSGKFTPYGATGDPKWIPESLTNFAVTSHTVEYDSTGKPIRGRCYLTLPPELLAYTDLPTTAAAEVTYTRDASPTVKAFYIQGIENIEVCSALTTKSAHDGRTLSKTERVIVSVDNTFFAEGFLMAEEARNGDGSEVQPVDLKTQLVWNAKWPLTDRITGKALAKKTADRLELEVVMGEGLTGAIRYEKDSNDKIYRFGREWIFYLHSGQEETYAIKQSLVGPNGQDLKTDFESFLSFHFPEDGSITPVPHFVVPYLSDISAKTCLFGIPLAWADNLRTMEVYDTGVMSIPLERSWNLDGQYIDAGDGWTVNIYGDSVDFQFKAGNNFSLHTILTFAQGEDFTISGGISAYVEGYNLDTGPIHLDKVLAGIELSGQLKLNLDSGAGSSELKQLLYGLKSIAFPVQAGSSRTMFDARSLVSE
jgi:hypothetical protein